MSKAITKFSALKTEGLQKRPVFSKLSWIRNTFLKCHKQIEATVNNCYRATELRLMFSPNPSFFPQSTSMSFLPFNVAMSDMRILQDGNDQRVFKSVRLSIRKDKYLCENAALRLLLPNVARQLNNIHLKIRTVPPLTMTISLQCWSSPDLSFI